MKVLLNFILSFCLWTSSFLPTLSYCSEVSRFSKEAKEMTKSLTENSPSFNRTQKRTITKMIEESRHRMNASVQQNVFVNFIPEDMPEEVEESFLETIRNIIDVSFLSFFQKKDHKTLKSFEKDLIHTEATVVEVLNSDTITFDVVSVSDSSTTYYLPDSRDLCSAGLGYGTGNCHVYNVTKKKNGLPQDSFLATREQSSAVGGLMTKCMTFNKILANIYYPWSRSQNVDNNTLPQLCHFSGTITTTRDHRQYIDPSPISSSFYGRFPVGLSCNDLQNQFQSLTTACDKQTNLTGLWIGLGVAGAVVGAAAIVGIICCCCKRR